MMRRREAAASRDYSKRPDATRSEKTTISRALMQTAGNHNRRLARVGNSVVLHRGARNQAIRRRRKTVTSRD